MINYINLTLQKNRTDLALFWLICTRFVYIIYHWTDLIKLYINNLKAISL